MPSVVTKVETPLYALAGVGDLAVEKLRGLAPTVQNWPTSFQHLSGSLRQVPSALQQLPINVQQQVGALRSRGQLAALRTEGVYGTLAARGRTAVRRSTTGLSSQPTPRA